MTSNGSPPVPDRSERQPSYAVAASSAGASAQAPVRHAPQWHRHLTWRHRRPAWWPGAAASWAVPLVALALACWYALRYLGDASLPGNSPAEPLGWWGWFDQSMTLRSTAALAHWNLDPSQHHYPLGYALLGVPSYFKAPNHPFFLVDLLSLLAAFAGFVAFSRRLEVHAALAAALFAAATLGDGVFFRQWVIPWNTTPVGASVWLLLAACAAWLDGRRRPFLIGLLAGSIPACRPSDAVLVLPCLATLAWSDLRADRSPSWTRGLRGWGWLAAGAAAVLAPVVALHLAIYGPEQSLYMRDSAQIGFVLHDFGWKAYVLLLDPYPWFADGKGLLQHAHWIALGLAGLVPALARGPRARMLAAVLVVHGVLYISYVDLLPTGLWRFNNVHYFAWAVPGYALLAALLVRDLTRPGRARRIAALSLAGTGLVLCLRCVPEAVAVQQPAKAVDFAGPMPSFMDTYLLKSLAVRDARGVLENVKDMRVFLYPGGVRVVGLRRDFAGPVEWPHGEAPQGFEHTAPAARWAESIRLAWPPRWLSRARPPGIPVSVK